ncbi:tetratricopeptide repeat protein [Granulicatella sp. zg-ZJ]|uniref:tetratricopeptide repeat protein n=1 Tax=Granulicatella sp. zg-ZJ TaxID=2678504 RepID=UPI0013D7D5FE|nr:tetratricopeptide repeat protein [Granulicatella sp. zg-ZJ]MBS4750667.1 tetratricopeptide repeat protein [Carnobacteriaceae bacterium zg-ZUI78]NEW62893.1 tetratricopeptide repeat protein [Granulicatella sp. zg-ZJ]
MNELGYKALNSIQDNQMELTVQLFQKSVLQAMSDNEESDAYDVIVSFAQLGFVEHAIENCEHAYQLWESEDWLLLLAELKVEIDALDEALEQLLMIPEQSPLYVNALLMIAEIYQIQGVYEVAQYKLELAKDMMPNEPIIDLALATLYQFMGEHQKALQHYEVVLQQEDEYDMVDIYYKASKSLIALGEFEEAISYLEKIDMTNHHSESLFELALSYYQLEEYERALKWFDALLVRDPDYLSAHYYMADVYTKLKQFDKAKALLRKALKENPYQAALYIQLYQIEKDIDVLKEAIVYVPDDIQVQLLYAHRLKELEDYEELVAYVEPLLTDEEDSELYWLLAYAYGKLEDDDKAQKYYEYAYPIYQEEITFLQEYALYLREIGQRDKAKQMIAKIKQLDPLWEIY